MTARALPEIGHTIRARRTIQDNLKRGAGSGLFSVPEVTMMSSSNGCLPTVRGVPQGQVRVRAPLYFIRRRADARFDEGILLRLAGRDVMPAYLVIFGPSLDRLAGGSGAVVTHMV
jgi:hypothetical protein